MYISTYYKCSLKYCNVEIGHWCTWLYFDCKVKNLCTSLADSSQNLVEVNSYAPGLALGLGRPSACPCRGAADIACGINFVTYPSVSLSPMDTFHSFALVFHIHLIKLLQAYTPKKNKLAKCAETILCYILNKCIQVNLAQQ